MTKKEINNDPIISAIELYNSTLEEIDKIFESKKTDKYSEGILLLSSIIEELLRILISSRLTFSKHFEKFENKTGDDILNYFDNSSFSQKIKIAVLLNIIDSKTYTSLESFRKNRNNIHLFFIRDKKPNFVEMYKISQPVIKVLTKKMEYYLKAIKYI